MEAGWLPSVPKKNLAMSGPHRVLLALLNATPFRYSYSQAARVLILSSSVAPVSILDRLSEKQCQRDVYIYSAD